MRQRNCSSKEDYEEKGIWNPNWVTRDQRALLIDTIINLTLRYVVYEISYKIYFINRESFVSAIAVFIAYKLAMEDAVYDLCELPRNQMLERINMTKNQG